jgi:hypothetical protein
VVPLAKNDATHYCRDDHRVSHLAFEQSPRPAPTRHPRVKRLARTSSGHGIWLRRPSRPLACAMCSRLSRREELPAVAQLGDSSHDRREGGLPTVREPAAVELLTAVAVGDNAEIRWRARAVLDQSDRTTDSCRCAGGRSRGAVGCAGCCWVRCCARTNRPRVAAAAAGGEHGG